MEAKEILTPCAEGGFVCMPREEFEKLLRKAVREGSSEGVRQALNQHDIKEITNLLQAWANTKATAWQTLVRIITTAFLAFIAWAVGSKVNFN
jgi:hypothetical protein